MTSRPGRSNKDANPKIVRRAAMDAEMDIRRKKVDARKRENEIEQIRINRQRLTKAMQRGELDQRKFKEINRLHPHDRKTSPHSRERRNSLVNINSDAIQTDEMGRVDGRGFKQFQMVQMDLRCYMHL